MLQRLPVGRRAIFCINKVDIRPPRNLKKCEKFKILLESCQVTSKLSADSFMGRWDRMVPQKMDFKKKIFEKVLISCGPPLVTGLRDILAENMIFGRKLTLWTPESTQKPYIDLPT